jgi:hypothetical protein
VSLFIWQLRQRDEAIRALLLVCVVVPLIVGVILATALMPLEWQEAVTKSLFVLVAAILPAVMYYLFLVAKRPSLFEEYVANLRRLGLVTEQMDRIDLDAYLQKFEASFGAIPKTSRDKLIEAIGRRSQSSDARGACSGTGDGLRRLVAFQASNLLSPGVLLPLALSTMVIGLGWLLVLPPLHPESSSNVGQAATLLLHEGGDSN